MTDVLWLFAAAAGIAAIVWGAETFAENLAASAIALGVSSFALALLLAGAEPEKLATGIVASLRHVPAVAFGDVIGANVAICLVALAVGALVAPLPFGPRVRRYGLLGLPLGFICAAIAWNGHVSRLGGVALMALYVVYVGVIWRLEGAPPTLGETAELTENRERKGSGAGRELVVLVGGVIAMAGGATVLVEAVRRVAHVESSQTTVSLTLVGLATAFELVVLAWSAQRRGAPEAVVAAVVGSFAYNATMTLGAAAAVRPLRITDQGRLHLPLVFMVASLMAVLVLGKLNGQLGRRSAVGLLPGYGAFTVTVLVAS